MIDSAKILRLCNDIEDIVTDMDVHCTQAGWTECMEILSKIKQIGKELAEQPTIEQKVRHGHWENIPGMNNTVFCSECLAAANKDLAMKYKGCPFCLARMDGGADNG